MNNGKQHATRKKIHVTKIPVIYW